MHHVPTLGHLLFTLILSAAFFYFGQCSKAQHSYKFKLCCVILSSSETEVREQKFGKVQTSCVCVVSELLFLCKLGYIMSKGPHSVLETFVTSLIFVSFPKVRSALSRYLWRGQCLEHTWKQSIYFSFILLYFACHAMPEDPELLVEEVPRNHIITKQFNCLVTWVCCCLLNPCAFL